MMNNKQSRIEIKKEFVVMNERGKLTVVELFLLLAVVNLINARINPFQSL